MKRANPIYANEQIRQAAMKAKNRFWMIVFIDESGIEKSELVYSYHVLTVELAKRFCRRPVTKVYSHVGDVDLECCDHILPLFVDIHW